MAFVKWNRKSVSVICRVTWFIIRPTIWNEFDIVCIKLWAFFCKFYMLSIKFNYAAPFSLLKLFKSWFHPSSKIVWPFGNFFVSFLCLRLFNISSICFRHVFDTVKCKARDFFATAFHSVFCSVSHRQVFTLIIVRSKAIACIWKFFSLVVFSCLYCSWSIYYPELIGV